MLSRLSSERISRIGVVEFAAAAATLVAGTLLLRRAGLFYLERPYAYYFFFPGVMALLISGWLVFRIVRRGEYP